MVPYTDTACFCKSHTPTLNTPLCQSPQWEGCTTSNILEWLKWPIRVGKWGLKLQKENHSLLTKSQSKLKWSYRSVLEHSQEGCYLRHMPGTKSICKSELKLLWSCFSDYLVFNIHTGSTIRVSLGLVSGLQCLCSDPPLNTWRHVSGTLQRQSWVLQYLTEAPKETVWCLTGCSGFDVHLSAPGWALTGEDYKERSKDTGKYWQILDVQA